MLTRPRQRPSQAASWAWLAWTIVAIVLIRTTVLVGVPFWQFVVFLGVQIVGYALPGLVWWRLLRRRTGTWFDDITLGWLTSHALILPVYFVTRLVGHPRAVWGYAILTVAAATGLPRFRWVWRGSARRSPAWFTWGVAAAVVGVTLWFQRPPYAPVRPRWPGSDAPFLISLAAEVKHHVPPSLPFVAGEPLSYHWFTFLDVAALSWQTGLPLDRLTTRLVPLTCVLLSLCALASLGRRLASSDAVGLAAVWLTALTGSASFVVLRSVYPNFYPNVSDGSFLALNWFGSPTMAFAFRLLCPLVYVLLDVFRRPGPIRAGTWLLLVVLSVGVMGAKVTSLPVLVCGVVLVALRGLFGDRRLARRALVVAAVLVSELVFAMLALYGAQSQGLEPQGERGIALFATWSGLSNQSTSLFLALCLLVVVGWLTPLPATVVLMLTRARRDPGVWLILGMAFAGMLGSSLVQQPGWSQFYFVRGALPFFYVLAAWGVVEACRSLGARGWAIAATSGAIGLAVASALRRHTDLIGADRIGAGDLFTALKVAVLTLAILGVVGLAIGSRTRTTTALLAVGACLLGMGAARTYFPTPPLRQVTRAPSKPAAAQVPLGGFEAAAYVQRRSTPDDLIATNAHCVLPPAEAKSCDTRAHWIAAWFERRVLVEGWAYSARASSSGRTMSEIVTSPFWDQDLLHSNDAVFTQPSSETLTTLVRGHHVRWLVVDQRFPVDLHRLTALLPDHHQFEDVWVFRVP